MREFLFTLTYENLTDKKELNFIVGETSTPPTWNTVKDHATKITRAFDSDALKSRRIYFSATEKLTGITFDSSGDATMSGAVVDLSQDGKTETEITKAEAAGIMVPASSYYVYVYDDAGGLVKQQQVTTAGYPSQASDFTEQVGAPGGRTSGAKKSEYLWGMDAWKDANDEYQILKDIEVRSNEAFFIPIRTRTAVDWDESDVSTYCPIYDKSKGLRFRARAPELSYVVVAQFNEGGVNPIGSAFVFQASPDLFTSVLATQEVNQTIDLMYLGRPGYRYDTFERCTESLGLDSQIVADVEIIVPLAVPQ